MPQTPRAPRFTPGMSQADLAAGYEKVGNRSPITKTDLQKAFEPYGLNLDPARKGASDKQLYHTAAKSVVDLFKKSKAQAAAQKPSPTQAPSHTAAPASTGASAPRAAGPASSSGFKLYDDDYVARAMRTVGLSGVSPSSVPAEFRRSYASLVAYLSQVKAQRNLALSAPKNVGSVPKTSTTRGGGGGVKLIR